MSKKIYRIISLVIALGMLFALVIPASAQLGDKDESAFYVQNVTTNDNVSVTVKFVSEDGTEYEPNDLGGGLTNPFTLKAGEAIKINVPDIPTSELPSGKRYSVVISSTDKVAAVAEVSSKGTKSFTGGYTGFSSGSTSTIVPTIAYNWFGWYGMLSVMNLGSKDTDVTVKLPCSNVNTTGTLTKKDLPPMASVTFVLKDTVPAGFSSSTQCIAAAIVTADQQVVAVNNQNSPKSGFTNTFEAYPDGFTKVYAPQIQNKYYGWNSSVNVAKVEPGNTKVTIAYSDGVVDTCDLTDAQPQCQYFMGGNPPHHPNFGNENGRFSATITTNPAKKILVAVGSSVNKKFSGGYAGFAEGYSKVSIPIFFRKYFTWNSAINCQNMGTVASKFKFDYYGEGSATWPKDANLQPGDSFQIFAGSESAVPDGYAGGVIVTPTVAGAKFACMIGNSSGGWKTLQGDHTFQFNAPGE